jgi:antitoxin ChpS
MASLFETLKVIDMKLKIQKWGNCAALILPSTLLSKIGAKIGDTLVVDPKTFRVVKPKYKLDDLINECDKNAKSPSDTAIWENMSPFGQEIV